MVLEELQSLLKIYLDKIDKVTSTFESQFGVKNPSKKWRIGEISRTGVLGAFEYAFHGAGCTVEFQNGEILSFDYKADDSITFDMFKFGLFLSSLTGQDDSLNKTLERVELKMKEGVWEVCNKVE